MVREELEHSIDNEGDEKDLQARNPQRVVDLSHFTKQTQSAMMAAQNSEEENDRDLDDPDFKTRKEAEEERGSAEMEAKEEPGQAAAEKILKAQQFAAQREREEEKME